MALVKNIADAVVAFVGQPNWNQITLDFTDQLLAVSLGSPVSVFTDKLSEVQGLYGLDTSQVDTIAAITPDLVLPPTWIIWAEENSTLGNTSYEWAYGNGASTPSTGGIIVPFGTWRLRGMGLHIGGTNAARTAIVQIRVNNAFPGQQVECTTGTSDANITFPEDDLIVVTGDRINFRTLSAASTASPCTVSAAFERVA